MFSPNTLGANMWEALPNYTGNKDRAETLTLGDTFTLGPTQVNSLHATFDRRRDDRADASNMFSPNTLGANMWEALPNYTQLTVSGYSGGGFAVGCGTCALATFNVNTYQLSDDFTYIRGRHQKIGRLGYYQKKNT